MGSQCFFGGQIHRPGQLESRTNPRSSLNVNYRADVNVISAPTLVQTPGPNSWMEDATEALFVIFIPAL